MLTNYHYLYTIYPNKQTMRKTEERKEAQEYTRSTRYRRLAAGALQRVMPGVLLDSGELLTEESLMSLLSARQPAAVMNLVSALHHYGLTTQIPDALSVALPRGVRMRRVYGFPVQVWYTTPALLADCTREEEGPHGRYRVTTPERTVVDCFKYRNKIGLSIFLEALAMSHGSLAPEAMYAEARRLRVLTSILPYLKSYYS